VPVGDQLLFYRDDGSYTVGHIQNGDFVQTHASPPNLAAGWTHIVPVPRRHMISCQVGNQSPRIRGIEVTQAIQTELNELPLIAHKTTVVRVYLDASLGSWPNVSA
jgi:hypothetical protein